MIGKRRFPIAISTIFLKFFFHFLPHYHLFAGLADQLQYIGLLIQTASPSLFFFFSIQHGLLDKHNDRLAG